MLVEHLRSEYPAALNVETSQDVELGDLVALYKAAKQRFDVDDEFKTRSREAVVKLQAGDEESLAAWESLCAASRGEYQKVRGFSVEFLVLMRCGIVRYQLVHLGTKNFVRV